MLKDLLLKNRSYRRYDSSVRISAEELEKLVDLTRLCPSAGNMQPLKYIIVSTDSNNQKVFECLTWAAYLKDWSGPKESERPTGYIIMLSDNEIKKNATDEGIAAQTIMLGAAEMGYGGCMLHAVNRKNLRELLSIPERYEISMVLALGKPKEKVVLEQVGENKDIKYWRDKDDVHHVPKRSLEELILGKY